MNNLTKTIVYVVLVIAAIGFGGKFYSSFKETKTRDVTAVAADDKDTALTDATVSTNQGTNVATADTNANTNAVPATNDVAQATTNAAATNVNVAATNAVADTNAVAQATNQPATTATNVTAASIAGIKPPKAGGGGSGSMMAYMGAFLATVLILGFLIARDVSGMFGQGAVSFLFNDDLKGVYDPEYEEALQAVQRGKPLDAIQLLREYLQKNPRAQYAALEIAEIYEKHLNNYLASALEYEEILKKKLPAERWGWAAIHLCNLYGKMGKTEKTAELLHRIVNEHGETAAAKKARKRLALYESGGDAGSLNTDVPETVADMAAAAVATAKVKAKEEAPAEPASNLPPGFRPKK
jgi:TolA-binding protein